MKLLRKLFGYNVILKSHNPPNKPRREILLDIISHANQTTEFYKGRFDTFLETAPKMSDEDFYYAYSHLPIATKQDLKIKNQDFMSSHLDGKTDLLQNGKAPKAMEFIKKTLFEKDFFTSLSTGGTSGTPTFRWLDYNDAQIFASSFIDSFKRNGWKPGESFVVFYPLKSYFTGTYAAHAKTLNRLFGFTMVPFENITRTEVEELLSTLKKNKSTLLVIFPCVLQRIAEIMKEEGIEPFTGLRYINVSGEFFLDCSKDFIQTMFPDSDIQSTYGAVEFGEIAHQKGRSTFDYDVFNDYVYIEEGPENSILVTAFYQKAFPLIRYKIEDMGKVETHDDGSQSLTTLEGKNTDYIIGNDGYMYFASFFNNFINEVNKEMDNPIIHFMLRHQEKSMELNFVIQDKSKQEQIEKAALDTMNHVFSNFDTITINFLDHFDHDYTRKFKVIGEGDGMAEVVGGYHQRKAS